MKNVVFLLGAGSSIPAGYSSTDCLTEQVVNSKEYGFDSADRVLPNCVEIPHEIEKTRLVRRIICWLKDRNQEYFDRRGENVVKLVNYEDIYYLASQLTDDYTELQNPALLPLIDRLKWEMTLWPEFLEFNEFRQRGNTMLRPEELQGVLEDTCIYIRSVVINILLRTQVSPCNKHLELITAVNQADKLNLKGIATLAHDTHVENFLRNQHVQIADGFSPQPTECKWRIWQDHFPENNHIPFMKLHGSVDWKRISKEKNDRRPDTIGIDMGRSERPNMPYHNGYSPESWLPRGQSILLMGTFNKPAMYAGPQLIDVHYRFKKILENTDLLIVCGYSFGDKSINTQLISWWHSSCRSIVVIDPNCQSMKEISRYAAQKLLCHPSTKLIEKKMEDDVCKKQLLDYLRITDEP